MRPVVPDLLLGFAVQELVDHLEGVLQFAGIIGRKPRPQHREQHHDDERHQQFHADEVGPRRARVVLQVDHIQNGIAPVQPDTR